MKSIVREYRKKPVIIEAIQFIDTAECMEIICRFLNTELTKFSYKIPGALPVLKIETLEGTMKANVGDYIIKGIMGEFYPCKPDIFGETYEKVEE